MISRENYKMFATLATAPFRFIEIHVFVPFTLSFLVGDKLGLPKSAPVGPAHRIVLSSQKLKRMLREAMTELLEQFGVPLSISSREIFEQLMVVPLVEAGVPRGVALDVVDILKELITGKSAKEMKEKTKRLMKEALKCTDAQRLLDTANTKQVAMVGNTEIGYIYEVAEAMCEFAEENGMYDMTRFARRDALVEGYIKATGTLSEDGKGSGKSNFEKNMRALGFATGCSDGTAAGLFAALFGRFATGRALERVAGAVSVNHSFSISVEQVETSDMSSKDELIDRDEAGHLNTYQVTSGRLYHYICIDLHQLFENCGGDVETSAISIGEILRILATHSPGAKKGSTAPYSYADMAVVNFTNNQPMTWSRGFEVPVPLAGDPLKNAYRAVSSFVNRNEQDYPSVYRDRLIFASGPDSALTISGVRSNFDVLVETVVDRIIEENS